MNVTCRFQSSSARSGLRPVRARSLIRSSAVSNPCGVPLKPGEAITLTSHTARSKWRVQRRFAAEVSAVVVGKRIEGELLAISLTNCVNGTVGHGRT